MDLPLRYSGGYMLSLIVLFASFGWHVFRPRRVPAAPRSRFVSGVGICVLVLVSWVCARFFYGLVFNDYPYYLIDCAPPDWLDYPIALRILAGLAISPIGLPAGILLTLYGVIYVLLQLALAVKRWLGLEPGPYRKLEWSRSGLSALLPQPRKKRGRIDQDDSRAFVVEVDNVSPDDFDSYCERCIEHGFVLPGFVPILPEGILVHDPEREHAAKMTPVHYAGRNADGCELELTLNAEFIGVMTITLRKEGVAASPLLIDRAP